MGALLYLVALPVVVAVAYKAGQNKARRERSSSSVEGELAAQFPGVCLTLPTDDGLLMVGPNDREWCQALAYHLQLAATCRRLGI